MPKPGASIVDRINNSKSVKVAKKRSEPLWLGPCSDDEERGGITQSMIGNFLVCRERFRLKVIEGLRPEPRFDSKSGFGNMWHVCEEHHAANADWTKPLLEYAKSQVQEFMLQQEEIDHWYRVCKTQFPIYVSYWKNHPDVQNRKPLMQEEVFHIPYTLPSGRIVWLRGKYDSVDLITEKIGGKKLSGVYLQENKTKGKIVPEQLKRQLKYDLQTMLYLISLQEGQHDQEWCNGVLGMEPIRGVRYNVIRRDCPIRRHQAKNLKKGFVPEETKDHFYNRLKVNYFEDAPAEWFMRWKVDVSQKDIEDFKKECLNPILKQICDWYEWVTTEVEAADMKAGFPFAGSHLHWRHPYGVYNILNEGGVGDTDEYMDSGSTIGLTRVDKLFTELR